jgi:hypothetical protein
MAGDDGAGERWSESEREAHAHSLLAVEVRAWRQCGDEVKHSTASLLRRAKVYLQTRAHRQLKQAIEMLYLAHVGQAIANLVECSVSCSPRSACRG